jgi:broad specificity phosphatase PhoE
MIRPTLALLFAAALGAQQPRSAPPTVVLLVRHAEKAAEPANDPPLTEAGEKRAQALAVAAKDAGVQAIITTQFVRTRMTAAAVARATGIDPLVVTAGGPADAHARAVADTIRKRFAGKVVLVVGHSNTIPAIVGALGAPRPPDLCDPQYDQLFVVVLSEDGPPKLIRSRYGAPSDDGATCGTMR